MKPFRPRIGVEVEVEVVGPGEGLELEVVDLASLVDRMSEYISYVVVQWHKCNATSCFECLKQRPSFCSSATVNITVRFNRATTALTRIVDSWKYCFGHKQGQG